MNADEMSERQQVEEVFRLTGGELHDEPWVSPTDESGRPWTFHHWYDEVPEYAESDLDWDPTYAEYRTVVRDNTFGTPPEKLGAWERIAVFPSSGEVELPPWYDPNEVTDDTGTPSGEFVYLGDGWAEVVYRRPLTRRRFRRRRDRRRTR